MKAAWIVATAGLALAACASSGPESQLGRQDEKPKRIEMTRTSDCVFQRNIDGFDALDDNYVVLYAMGRRKAYLADVTGGCFDVKSQFQLAAVDGDRNGQICGFGRDSIAYRRLGMVEDCRIIGLQELSDERRLELGLGVPPRPEKAPGEEKAEDRPGDGDGR
jgi:hypothetical protein